MNRFIVGTLAASEYVDRERRRGGGVERDVEREKRKEVERKAGRKAGRKARRERVRIAVFVVEHVLPCHRWGKGEHTHVPPCILLPVTHEHTYIILHPPYYPNGSVHQGT